MGPSAARDVVIKQFGNYENWRTSSGLWMLQQLGWRSANQQHKQVPLFLLYLILSHLQSFKPRVKNEDAWTICGILFPLVGDRAGDHKLKTRKWKILKTVQSQRHVGDCLKIRVKFCSSKRKKETPLILKTSKARKNWEPLHCNDRLHIISYHVHPAGDQQYQHNYLTASSSSSSLTNWRGICRDSALSAICSRIRRWLPSVVGNRYVRDMTPPNTEADRNIVSQPCIQRPPVTKLSHRCRVQEDDI